MCVTFYCGVNDMMWNYHPVSPGEYACISPVYGKTERTRKENRVRIPQNTKIIQDSGAFSDGFNTRLSAEQALDRQLSHSIKYGYDSQIVARASYDVLIDEMWNDGERLKGRWTESAAWKAVEQTIKAAEYTAKNLSERAILSAQGVSPSQYMVCVKAIAPLLRSGDILGLGGWCISGKMPSVMMPTFCDTITGVIPYLGVNNVKSVHIWGVIDVEFLAPLLYLCDRHSIELSTDSAGPQLRPVMGEWGYKGWKDKNFVVPHVSERGLYRALHVQKTREWLNELRLSPYYGEPKTTRTKVKNGMVQRSLF